MNKKTGLLFVLLLWAVSAFYASSSLSLPASPGAGVSQNRSDTIAVGSFNIQIFGITKINRPHTLAVLAETAANFDIMAVQEVGSNGSSASDKTCALVMNTYTNTVNSFLKSPVYRYVRSNQYAILYRSDRIELIKSGPYTGSRVFTYDPLTAYFKVKDGNFDFCFVTVHTRPERAQKEIPELKTVMAEVSQMYGDPDVICAGDYNGDGSYYAEGPSEDLQGFSGYITGIPNSAKTNVSLSHDYTYDRMEMTPSLKSDFTGRWGVFNIARSYDVSGCEGTKTTAGKEAALSDHYPVWCLFYTNRDTD